MVTVDFYFVANRELTKGSYKQTGNFFIFKIGRFGEMIQIHGFENQFRWRLVFPSPFGIFLQTNNVGIFIFNKIEQRVG